MPDMTYYQERFRDWLMEYKREPDSRDRITPGNLRIEIAKLALGTFAVTKITDLTSDQARLLLKALNIDAAKAQPRSPMVTPFTPDPTKIELTIHVTTDQKKVTL